MIPVYIKTYWMVSSTNVYEIHFKQAQVQNRSWAVSAKGLPFIQAATLVEEWNRQGNKHGYHYYLHKPERL